MDHVLELGRSAVRSFRARVGQLVECLSGAVWLTQEGDSRDHVLAPGDARVIESSGRVAVQALRTARVRIVDPSPRRSAAAWRGRESMDRPGSS